MSCNSLKVGSFVLCRISLTPLDLGQVGTRSASTILRSSGHELSAFVDELKPHILYGNLKSCQTRHLRKYSHFLVPRSLASSGAALLRIVHQNANIDVFLFEFLPSLSLLLLFQLLLAAAIIKLDPNKSHPLCSRPPAAPRPSMEQVWK